MQNNAPKIFFHVQGPQIDPKLAGFALKMFVRHCTLHIPEKQSKIPVFGHFGTLSVKNPPPSSEGHIY